MSNPASPFRVLELRDSGLRLFEGETVLFDSPGCAALDERRLLVGETARGRMRIDPRRANDRFWYQLDTALSVPLGDARTAADLAHAHLQSLGEALILQPLVLAAPGSFTPGQLGILLGLLQAVGARTIGLVDGAVAAASTAPASAQAVHIDVQWHRVVCTWMEGQQDLARTRVQELKPGLAAMQDRVAAVIAAAFVRNARFDPLHNARTEQALYDRLPEFTARLASETHTVLELQVDGRTHRASVARETVEDALADRIEALADAVLATARTLDASVMLSVRAASLPGLAARLSPVTLLDDAASARGAQENAARICTDTPELPWIARLPRRVMSIAGEVIDAAPTHALIGARAKFLPARGQSQALSAWLPGAPGILRHGNEGLRLEDAGGASVRVNGEVANSARALKLGDRIACSGVELRLIDVQSAEASAG